MLEGHTQYVRREEKTVRDEGVWVGDVPAASYDWLEEGHHDLSPAEVSSERTCPPSCSRKSAHPSAATPPTHRVCSVGCCSGCQPAMLFCGIPNKVASEWSCPAAATSLPRKPPTSSASLLFSARKRHAFGNQHTAEEPLPHSPQLEQKVKLREDVNTKTEHTDTLSHTSSIVRTRTTEGSWKPKLGAFTLKACTVPILMLKVSTLQVSILES